MRGADKRAARPPADAVRTRQLPHGRAGERSPTGAWSSSATAGREQARRIVHESLGRLAAADPAGEERAPQRLDDSPARLPVKPETAAAPTRRFTDQGNSARTLPAPSARTKQGAKGMTELPSIPLSFDRSQGSAGCEQFLALTIRRLPPSRRCPALPGTRHC